MEKKQRVGILFGGRSGEHEVSLLSAASILKAIDRSRFDVVPIGISKTGRWLMGEDAQALLNGTRLPKAAGRKASVGSVALCPEPGRMSSVGVGLSANSVDILFPVLHGTFGEDGTIQGLFELADLPYVGSGVLGSSTGMDKDVMKRLFAEAGLPLVKHVTMLRSEWERQPRKGIAAVEAKLKYPVFVKPANMGSSVGISKVHDRAELGPALTLASQYDRKLVVEEGVGGTRRNSAKKARELEVAVLGNDSPRASVVGEITPGKEFYDYEDKYLATGSVATIPAKLTRTEERTIRTLAVKAFEACDLAGLARVDFLMEPDGKRRIYLNEVNTLPGFTEISMYPKLWAASGVPYPALISELIDLAVERHAEKKRTVFSREA